MTPAERYIILSFLKEISDLSQRLLLVVDQIERTIKESIDQNEIARLKKRKGEVLQIVSNNNGKINRLLSSQ